MQKEWKREKIEKTNKQEGRGGRATTSHLTGIMRFFGISDGNSLFAPTAKKRGKNNYYYLQSAPLPCHR